MKPAKAYDTSKLYDERAHKQKYGWFSLSAWINYAFLIYISTMLTIFALSPEWFSTANDREYISLNSALRGDTLVITLSTVANFTLAFTDLMLAALWFKVRRSEIDLDLDTVSDKFIGIFLVSGGMYLLIGVSFFIGYYKLILFFTPVLLYYSWLHAFGLARDLWQEL